MSNFVEVLDSDTVGRIVLAIQISFDKALQLFGDQEGWKGRMGAYSCLTGIETALPLLVVPVGRVPLERAGKYLEFCQEKPRRLVAHPGHRSSYQSRNPDAKQYGGAVKIIRDIFSMSGLPELGDEAVMLGAAMMFFKPVPVSMNVLDEVAAISNNPYWKPLSEALLQDPRW